MQRSKSNSFSELGPGARAVLPVSFVGLLACLLSCGEPVPPLPNWNAEVISNASPAGAMSPSLSAHHDEVWLSWLAPLSAPTRGADAEPIWTVGTARLEGKEFVDAGEISRTDDMFANWADFPSTTIAPSGTQYAHHLGKLGDATFAYGVFLQGRRDATSPWSDIGLLHDDDSETEHGFVSYTVHGDASRAFWLDGRGMLAGGPMTLRTAELPSLPEAPEVVPSDVADNADERFSANSSVGGSTLAEQSEAGPQRQLGPTSVLLDERVCECCQTDAATTSDGPIVVYRDRSLEEIRDIYVVRFEDGRWTKPVAVHNDGWEIAGCPVNGPAIAADGDFVAVAWFTAADDKPRTRLAISLDGGRSFSSPTDLAGGRAGGTALGRIDLVLRSGNISAAASRPVHELWVGHFGRPKDAEADGPGLLVDHLRFDGKLRRGSQTVIAAMSEARSSGFPRMAATDEGPLIAWVEAGDPSRVRTARLVVGDDAH